MTPPKEKKEGENVARQFKTIEFDDRKTIASMYANGAIAGEIAQKIGVSRTTVYTELKRGQDGVTLDKNFRPAYDPELAQKRVQEGLRRRGRKKEGNAYGSPRRRCQRSRCWFPYPDSFWRGRT